MPRPKAKTIRTLKANPPAAKIVGLDLTQSIMNSGSTNAQFHYAKPDAKILQDSWGLSGGITNRMAKAGRARSKKAACCSLADALRKWGERFFFHSCLFFEGLGPILSVPLLSDSNVVNCPPQFHPIGLLDLSFNI